MRLCISLVVAAVLGCLLVSRGEASISYTAPGVPYTQDFNTLAASGSANTWANDTTNTGTLDGWYLLNSTSADITAYAAGTGSIGTGSYYSFGAAVSSERALGGVGSGGAYFGSPAPASGAIAGWIAFAAKNDTAKTLDSFTVGFNGEQWRNGGNASAQAMVLEYGFGSTFSGVSTWTAPGGDFDWTSPVATTTAAAVDGNAAGLVANRGGTISSLTWADGETLWIRWTERNDVGNDHGLAIDDFSFTANFTAAVVPEPASLLVWGGIGLLGVGLAIYKKKVA